MLLKLQTKYCYYFAKYLEPFLSRQTTVLRKAGNKYQKVLIRSHLKCFIRAFNVFEVRYLIRLLWKWKHMKFWTVDAFKSPLRGRCSIRASFHPKRSPPMTQAVSRRQPQPPVSHHPTSEQDPVEFNIPGVPLRYSSEKGALSETHSRETWRRKASSIW